MQNALSRTLASLHRRQKAAPQPDGQGELARYVASRATETAAPTRTANDGGDAPEAVHEPSLPREETFGDGGEP